VEVLSDDPHFQPVALVDVVPANLAWARERSGLPETVCFSEVAAALRQVEVDALVIAVADAYACQPSVAPGSSPASTCWWRKG